MQKDIKEFIGIIRDIKRAQYFNNSRHFNHHGGKSTIYRHSISCAYCSYKIAKALKLSEDKIKSVTIAALLHDSYGYDRVANHIGIVSSIKQNRGIHKLTHLHAFYHGYEAVNFVSKYIDLNEEQKNAIITHMFPLYPIPPIHTEGWILTVADKIVASGECFDTLRIMLFRHKNKSKITLKLA